MYVLHNEPFKTNKGSTLKIIYSLLILTFLIIAPTSYGKVSSHNAIKKCSPKEQENLQMKTNFYASQSAIADEMTTKLETEFKKSSANVVLIGNVGKDVSDRNIVTPSRRENKNFTNKYMHGGLAYKDPKTKEWKIIHLLNEYDNCANTTNKSIISNDKLRTFFTRPHYMMDIQMQVPSEELQNKLLKIILHSPEVLHESQYSAIANPASLEYQNSNQFILNLISTAQKDTPNCKKAISAAIQKGEINIKDSARQKAQLCAFANGFQPAIMNAETLESVGVMFGARPEVSIDDHNYKSKFSSNYQWVSYPSLSDYLKASDPNSSPIKEICPNFGCNRTKHELYVKYLTQQAKKEESEQNQ